MHAVVMVFQLVWVFSALIIGLSLLANWSWRGYSVNVSRHTKYVLQSCRNITEYDLFHKVTLQVFVVLPVIKIYLGLPYWIYFFELLSCLLVPNLFILICKVGIGFFCC